MPERTVSLFILLLALCFYAAIFGTALDRVGAVLGAIIVCLAAVLTDGSCILELAVLALTLTCFLF